MLEWGLKKGNTYSLLEQVPAGTTTMEISMKFPQKSKNISTIGSIHTISGQVPKGLCILHKIYLLIHFSLLPYSQYQSYGNSIDIH